MSALVSSGEADVVEALLEEFHPSDIADVVESLDEEDRLALLRSLPSELASETLAEMEEEIAERAKTDGWSPIGQRQIRRIGAAR